MAIVSFALVGVGVLLIVVGCWMSYKDWEGKDVIKTERHSLDKDISALTKLMIAIKGYPPGQQLIVLGIVILIIAGIFGGITKL